MTRILALGFVVAGLLGLPAAAGASNVTPRSVFVPDTVYARQWAPAHAPRVVAPRGPARHGVPAGVIVGAPAPQPVWVHPGWAWDGWQWVWVPGHWGW